MGVKVTADDIAQLLASAPPRPVPAQVMQAARRNRAKGSTTWFGFFFGTFGLLFVGVFFPVHLWDQWHLAGGAARTVAGEITAVQDARMQVNRVRVYRYDFAYTPAGGARRVAFCYASGERWFTGEKVPVRYLPATPEVAVVDGGRLNKVGGLGFITLVFPLAGYSLAAWFVVQRRRAGRLLREGVLAEVDVVAVNPTAMRVNNRPVFEIVIAAPALGSQAVRLKRLDARDVDLATQRVAQKQPVFVLYDARQPSRLIFPEALIEP